MLNGGIRSRFGGRPTLAIRDKVGAVARPYPAFLAVLYFTRVIGVIPGLLRVIAAVRAILAARHARAAIRCCGGEGGRRNGEREDRTDELELRHLRFSVKQCVRLGSSHSLRRGRRRGIGEARQAGMIHGPRGNGGERQRRDASDRRAVKRYGTGHRAVGVRGFLCRRVMLVAFASCHCRSARNSRHGNGLADRPDPHHQHQRKHGEKHRAHKPIERGGANRHIGAYRCADS